MRRNPTTFFACTLFCLTSLANSGCGQFEQTEPSTVRDVHDVPADLIQPDVARSLFFQLRRILDASSAPDGLAVADVMAVIPISSSDLARVQSRFPRPAGVQCAQGLCESQASGSSVDVVIRATIGGVSNPTLRLSSALDWSFGAPSLDTVILCSMNGFKVRKSIFTKTIRALSITVEGGSPKGAVSGQIDIGNAALECP